MSAEIALSMQSRYPDIYVFAYHEPATGRYVREGDKYVFKYSPQEWNVGVYVKDMEYESAGDPFYSWSFENCSEVEAYKGFVSYLKDLKAKHEARPGVYSVDMQKF